MSCKFIGPRQRARIRRRRWKAAAVATVIMTLALAGSWTSPRPPVVEEPVRTLIESDLVSRLNVCRYSPGYAAACAETFPLYAEQFIDAWETSPYHCSLRDSWHDK